MKSQSDKTTNTKIKKGTLPKIPNSTGGAKSMASKGRKWGSSKTNGMPKK